MHMRAMVIGAVALSLQACSLFAGSAEVPPAPQSEAIAEPEPEPVEVPTACADDDSAVCTPPAKFVERLCNKTTPNVALSMFHKSTPWKRAYVRTRMEAWYVGARSQPVVLPGNEEVLIVADRSNNNGTGFSVAGYGSYDVYRFDGTCVSLMSDEISLRSPGRRASVAPLKWRLVDDDVKDVLRQDESIARHSTKQRDACRAPGWDAAQLCDHQTMKLSKLVAQYLRRGGDVPAPKPLY